MSYFKGGVKKYSNIKKMSNIPVKMLLNDEVINELEKLRLVTIVHKGTIILDYINNCKQEGDIVFSITNFNNIGLYLDYYNGENKIIKCENKDCEELFKQSNHTHKYCKICAKDVDREKARERMKNIRMFET